MPSTGVIPVTRRPGAYTPHSPGSAFTLWPNPRPLRVVVDRATVRNEEAADVLLGFAFHDDVEVISTDPADGLWRIEFGPPDHANDFVPVKTYMGTNTLSTGAWSLLTIRNLAKAGPGPAQEVEDALILEQGVSSISADALVTRNSHLLGNEHAWYTNGNSMTPDAAVALLGLYLRLRGDFTYERGGDPKTGRRHSLRFDRGLYYWVVTRSLLPAAWRWFSACVYSSSASGDDALLALGNSALMRVDRALRARDRIHEQFKIEQNNNTMDEAHFYLDVVLLQLGGAFDAVARVAHIAHGMRGGYDYAGWRRGQWRSELVQKAPTLASLTERQRAARDAVDLVALLRNSIHGEALQGVTLRRGTSVQRMFRVPSTDAPQFVSAVRRRGGLKRWGITQLGRSDFFIAADRFVEALIPDAARALNRLMRATEVSNLPGVQGVRLRSRPPEGRDSEFNRFTRKRLRLLAGL